MSKQVREKLDNKEKMYIDISRLVRILERIAKKVEREMKNNDYGKQ